MEVLSIWGCLMIIWIVVNGPPLRKSYGFTVGRDWIKKKTTPKTNPKPTKQNPNQSKPPKKAKTTQQIPPHKKTPPRTKTNQPTKTNPKSIKDLSYCMCAHWNDHDQLPKQWHRTALRVLLMITAFEIRGVKLVYNSYRNKYHVTGFFSLILAAPFVNWNAK